jgi:hypothetical protein
VCQRQRRAKELHVQNASGKTQHDSLLASVNVSNIIIKCGEIAKTLNKAAKEYGGNAQYNKTLRG